MGYSKVKVLFDRFHHNECLPRGFSSYFITLIPKTFDSHSLREYRPISLLGSIYKLVAKDLATRLAAVMDSIVNHNQLAFLKGRLLVDGVLVVNEVVDLAKR